MERKIDRLSSRTHDILIVGGGIYGCTLAREAALRGLSVAIVDKSDFCSATSANSLKIIHGGIRYLQQFDLPRLRQSVKERRTIMRIAPHLIHPLLCAMPTSGSGMKSRAAMFCGLLANRILSLDRNNGLPPEKQIGPGRLGSRAEWLALAPDLADPRFTGVGFWEDAYAYNTERLATAFLKAAARAGTEAANYTEVTGFLRNGREITGVTAVDRETGKLLQIHARCTVVNTGPWTRHTLDLLDEKVAFPDFKLALTLNIVLRRQLSATHAMGIPAYRAGWKRGRLYFFVPWRGRTMIGTHMRLHQGNPDTARVSAEDLAAFLSILNMAHPGARITQPDVSFVQAGLLPAKNQDVGADEEPELLNHFTIVDHAAADGMKGLLTVLGVKYTTARDVAERTLTALARHLGRTLPAVNNETEALPGGDCPDLHWLLVEAEAAGFSADMARHLVYNYGTEFRDVIRLGARDNALLRPLGHTMPILGAEVLYAVRQEMARTLADVVLRRTDLGSAGLPDESVLRKVALLMANELHWDPARIEREIAELQAQAAPPA